MIIESCFLQNAFYYQKNKWENVKKMEEPGFEPGAFRMRSGHSTTELHPLIGLNEWYIFTVFQTTNVYLGSDIRPSYYKILKYK